MSAGKVAIMPFKPPQAKKARYMSGWESTLALEDDGSNKLGLRELFGGRRVIPRQTRRNHAAAAPHQAQQAGRRPLQRFLEEQQRDGFFALRLEHREGGAMAKHVGEERILLFRSDRAGAIAKIIYSSMPATPPLSKVAGNKAVEEADLSKMVQARVHVLDVKEPYRGHDLGGLLFSEAISSLRHRYMDPDDDEDGVSMDNGHVREEEYVSLHSIRCQLDAEEDIRRHNKLITFYEQLGCRVKPNAKVQYIHNNDGETYRKIPMQMALRPSMVERNHKTRRRKFLSSTGSLVDRSGSFLPVRLLQASGRALELPLRAENKSRRVDWLAFDDGEGRIQLRTTQGQYLRADPDGRCTAAVVSEDESDESNTDTPPEDWASFHLYRVSDFIHQDDAFSSDESDSEALTNARQKELWMLQSAHGTFMTADAERNTICCSKVPAFWQADDDTFSLVCTSDTPPRRQHYRKAWTKQTVEYVTSMRDRYLSFSIKRMTIQHALNLVHNTPYHQFRVSRNHSGPSPSLRTLSFRMAEACRAAGHPDWVQFVALVHELGTVLNYIDISTAAESEDDFDWTITACRSHIVGCAAPERTNFNEFRRLSADERDSRYSSPQGMYDIHCGLENVLVSWTGPEYMYHMMRHNEAVVPDEGLAMLRYFPLADWHRHNDYGHLVDANDCDVKQYVAEFDQLRRAVRRQYTDSEDLSDRDCNRLWDEHYGYVVAKYVGDGELKW